MALINRPLTADEVRAMLEDVQQWQPAFVALWDALHEPVPHVAQPGCPDPDWCRNNGTCYWNCQADPDIC